jgi:hypothetical protein
MASGFISIAWFLVKRLEKMLRNRFVSPMGCTPHSARLVLQLIYQLIYQIMKTNYGKPLLFGGFINAAEGAWDGPMAERYVAPKRPSRPARMVVPTAWHEAGFPVRIIAKLRAEIASRIPVGYEDETGFHYGVKVDD